MKKTYLLLLIIGLAFMSAAILFGGAGLLIALDGASLVFVVGLALVVSLMGGSFREIGSYYRVVFRDADEADAVLLKKASAYFRTLRNTLIVAGLCGTLAGIIVMLSMLSDASTIGRGMALALITLFYAAILILLVALPFELAAKKLLAEKGK